MPIGKWSTLIVILLLIPISFFLTGAVAAVTSEGETAVNVALFVMIAYVVAVAIFAK